MHRFPSGARLRQLRKDAGVSVEEMALVAGKTAYTIHGYELGRVEPPLHVLSAIAMRLDTTVGAILGEQAHA